MGSSRTQVSTEDKDRTLGMSAFNKRRKEENLVKDAYRSKQQERMTRKWHAEN